MNIKHILQTVQTVSHSLTQRTAPTTLTAQTRNLNGIAIRSGVRAGANDNDYLVEFTPPEASDSDSELPVFSIHLS